MEERRLILAVALSLLILTAYSLLFSPASVPERKAATGPTPPAATAAGTPATPAPTARPALPAEASSTAPTAPLAAETGARGPAVADEREHRVEVVSPEGTVAFTNRGARLVSWTLKRQLDARGRPEEMIPAQAGGVRPLDVETGDATIDARLREALFLPSADTVTARGPGPALLDFRWSDGAGLEAEKRLSFPATGGLVAIEVFVRRDGRNVPCRLVWGPGLGNETREERDVRGYQPPSAAVLQAGRVVRVAPGKLPSGGEAFEGVLWAGVESHYFGALFVTPSGAGRADVRPIALPVTAGEKPTTTVVVDVDASGPQPVLLYVGAKDHPALARLGYELQKVVPVGDWLGPIVVPLMALLRWVYEHVVGNWGWAIVLLTLLINLAMAPFRHYSIVNGLKMAKISPEMRVIQERYRKVPLMDPRRQQMQEEIGALYARHGMSMGSQMAVGCLPLLLTMPFLFAFYRVLSVSVELRGASFLWVPDLAAKDPLYIMPIVMGVTMFAMQKMTPTAMDPAQQRIMMLMPLMLAGMFLWAPAGLNLYWLTSNVWSVGQQFVEMRVLKPVDARARERRGK
jgi:YidC/Oxa1 family membrane protein insertase